MTSEKMTVHKALAELKVIDKRITDAISEASFVVANKHTSDKVNGVALNDFREQAKSQKQRIDDLIARRNALKRAVVLSNASTVVKIGDTDYTVAEAIEMKNHGMTHKKDLLQQMVTQYHYAQNTLNLNSGDSLERRAETYILSVVSSQPKDSKMSVDSEAMKALRSDYIKNNAYDLVDPIGIASCIKNLKEEIEQFETDVDAALSVSNALTVIEFSY